MCIILRVLLKKNGHFHYIYSFTGPAIPVSDGSHYHEIYKIETDNKTYIHLGNMHKLSSYPQHTHWLNGLTGFGIGYELI